jgi:hypothetical protein
LPTKAVGKDWVVFQFELTPKAFVNFSPGLEGSDNPEIRNIKVVVEP